ncbi:hypothetical protein QA943_00940 [Streptomyces sp. B21-097]|uniref:DUF6005 family protein n=1 Tax=Streptomyces sp. B21-097 TaxID=3039414 RepID=UPI002FF2836D
MYRGTGRLGEMMSIVAFEAGDCNIASYGTAVRAAGLDPIVLGCRRGFEWRHNPALPLGEIRLALSDIPTDIKSWYDVDIVKEDFPDAGTALERLASAGDWPVIVDVDSYHLPYSSTFQREHYPHTVVLIEVRSDGVFVVDGYRGYRFDGVLDMNTMLQALGSPPRPGAMDFDLVPRHDADSVSVRAARVRSRIPDQSADPTIILDRVRDNMGPFDDAGSGDRVGVEAVVAIADTLHAAVDEGLAPGAVYDVLSFLGSVASQRSLNADFLAWAATQLDMPTLAAGATLAEHASRRWGMLRNWVYLRANKNPSALHRAADMLVEIAAEEKELSAALGSAVEKG